MTDLWTAEDLIGSTLGIRTWTYSPEEVTVVNPTPTLILRNNPNRIAYCVVNCGPNPAYSGHKENVAVLYSSGLAPNGGIFSLDWREDYNRPGLELWMRADGLGTNVFVIVTEITGRWEA